MVGLELLDVLANQGGVKDEDCLYLNVWSKPQSGAKQKPVMVYIYGGAFDGGSSTLPTLDGAAFTDQGDVIIVTFK